VIPLEIEEEFSRAILFKNKALRSLTKNPLMFIYKAHIGNTDYHAVRMDYYLSKGKIRSTSFGVYGDYIEAMDIRDSLLNIFYGIKKSDIDEIIHGNCTSSTINQSFKSIGYPVYSRGGNFFSVIAKNKKNFLTKSFSNENCARMAGFELYLSLYGKRHKKDPLYSLVKGDKNEI